MSVALVPTSRPLTYLTGNRPPGDRGRRHAPVATFSSPLQLDTQVHSRSPQRLFPTLYILSCGAVLSTLLSLPLPPRRLAWPLLLPLVVPPRPSFPPMFHPSLQNDVLPRLSLTHASHADAFIFSLSLSTRYLLPTNGTALRRKSRPS